MTFGEIGQIAANIVPVLTFIGTCLIGGYSWFSHNKIVGNDLHHLSADVKSIKDCQEKMSTKVITLAEDVAYLKGRTEVRKSYAKKKLKV